MIRLPKERESKGIDQVAFLTALPADRPLQALRIISFGRNGGTEAH